MHYRKEIVLKDGRKCLLRNIDISEAEDYLEYYIQVHNETDYLAAYPGESLNDTDASYNRLRKVSEDPGSIEIGAYVDGVLAGSVGITPVHKREKTAHRAQTGISVMKVYWGLGIGKALMQAALECAADIGYRQVELEVLSENHSARNLYEQAGFITYGNNPCGFMTRDGSYQELILMRKELR